MLKFYSVTLFWFQFKMIYKGVNKIQ
jgi:uncharacterized membrane protein